MFAIFVRHWYFIWKCLNVGTVPTHKMHNIGAVPMFKMHNIGTPKFYDLCVYKLKGIVKKIVPNDP